MAAEVQGKAVWLSLTAEDNLAADHGDRCQQIWWAESLWQLSRRVCPLVDTEVVQVAPLLVVAHTAVADAEELHNTRRCQDWAMSSQVCRSMQTPKTHTYSHTNAHTHKHTHTALTSLADTVEWSPTTSPSM